jgi:predicted Fe-Mo cluster-binding NifX family protein
MKMNKRIAIPMENGRLCAHFGHCQSFALIEVQEGIIKNIEEITPPEHQPGLYPRWIAGFKVTDVIAGGMGQKAIQLFNAQNINVFVGAPPEGARELVNAFLAGTLELQANDCHREGDQHQHGSCHQ